MFQIAFPSLLFSDRKEVPIRVRDSVYLLWMVSFLYYFAFKNKRSCSSFLVQDHLTPQLNVSFLEVRSVSLGETVHSLGVLFPYTIMA